jgi:hypothetical protein
LACSSTRRIPNVNRQNPVSCLMGIGSSANDACWR